MNITVATYMLIWEGASVGTVCYQGGLLRMVNLITPSAGAVAAVMALLPSREQYLNAPDTLLGALNLDNLELRHGNQG